jgi:hypothetical protein
MPNSKIKQQFKWHQVEKTHTHTRVYIYIYIYNFMMHGTMNLKDNNSCATNWPDITTRCDVKSQFFILKFQWPFDLQLHTKREMHQNWPCPQTSEGSFGCQYLLKWRWQTDPCLGRNLCCSQEFARFLADTAAESAGLEIDTACTLTGTTLATPVLQATSNTDEQVNTNTRSVPR